MKVIIDTPQEDMGMALNAVFQVQIEHPDQQVGSEFAVSTEANGKPYIVIRNLNSYTIKSPA